MKKSLGSLLLLGYTALLHAALAKLDKIDSFPETAFDWDVWIPYVNGALLFIAGFIASKFSLVELLIKKIKEKRSTK